MQPVDIRILSAVQEEDSPTDSAFLDTISNDKRVWNSEFLVAGKKVTLKIDTGAEVITISKATRQSLGMLVGRVVSLNASDIVVTSITRQAVIKFNNMIE